MSRAEAFVGSVLGGCPFYTDFVIVEKGELQEF